MERLPEWLVKSVSSLPPSSRPQAASKAALLLRTVYQNPFVPDAIKDGLFPKQLEFLAYSGREALYGGAAGGGKSVALLVAALQYVEEPGYAAVILRRTFKQLSKADSILNKAKEWLMPHVNAKRVKWNGDDHKFTFPSGATLEFGHMDHENSIYDYQGGIWAYIGADEATQFTGTLLAYPRTRQRRPANSQIPMRWRGASNPGGIGHDYVKSRYVKLEDGSTPAKYDRNAQFVPNAFFPATIDDNPHIDREDYIKALRESGIDGVLLDQLLKGDWDAVAGGRFKKEWFGRFRPDDSSPDFLQVVSYDGQVVERFNFTTNRSIFQTCDPAASASTAADYFVLSTWAVTPKANILWLGCEREKLELPEQVQLCQRSYRRHGAAFLCVEEVLNQRGLAQLLRRSRDPVMAIRGVTPGGKKKVELALSAIVLASTGRIFLPAANPMFPMDDVLSEVTRFTGDDKKDANDDIVDTLSQMALQVPQFTGGAKSTPPKPYAPNGIATGYQLGPRRQ